MQFHLNGFQPGEPRIASATANGARPDASGVVDVLIVGCGPAGLTLAAQLAMFPDITTRIIEQKPGPLLMGQADGIACRTMEMFEAFGFAERVAREAYWVNETSFWKPGPQGGDIVRSERIQDVEDGLSEFPHVILNQSRVHDFYLDFMRKAPAPIEPDYSRQVLGIDLAAPAPAPASASANGAVAVRVERGDPGHEGEVETIRARYVVGCDGARSAVRKALGLALEGGSANQIWGVMDILAVTDFPDIRLKATIHSASEGSMLIIPREGGYLVRFYVELDQSDPTGRFAREDVTVERLIATAQRILHPFRLDVKEVAWWSVYEIGQRLCARFDDVPEAEKGHRFPRVFIAGDACHTHSPKAGQGMNVSMQDAFNLGWKLAAVVQGRSPPELLSTYSDERRAVAKELIDFDRAFAGMFSSAKPAAEPAAKAAGSTPDGHDAGDFQRYFVQKGRFTAGVATQYPPSLISGVPTHQQLASGFIVGMRLHSAPVVRFLDAKPVHLGHAFKADGRWRVIAFADRLDPGAPSSGVRALCDFLDHGPASPLRAYTAGGDDIDAVIDVRAVFQQDYRSLAAENLPALLLPPKGKYGLRDYEKVFCADHRAGNDIFDLRGIDRERGCLVVVRPDQFVANVLPLDGYDELADFFRRFMCEPQKAFTAVGVAASG